MEKCDKCGAPIVPPEQKKFIAKRMIELARALRAEREQNGPYTEERIRELDEKLEQELLKRWSA